MPAIGLVHLNTINQLAGMVAKAPSQHDPVNLSTAHTALIDTVSCMFAGAHSSVSEAAFSAVERWGEGHAVVVGRTKRLSPPFAALVNASAGHALDFDDYDAAANSHPSVVIFPALFALASERSVDGRRLLDAYIVGLEVLQRLGEAFGPEHYKRGWLSTMTLGVIGVTGACCRLTGADHETAATALSLAVSMASGLTNQLGYTAKQLHPGLVAKNAIMAVSFAAAGVTASDKAIDGPVGLARLMCDYDQNRFDQVMAKLANPWSIQEHGIVTKVSPACGYTQRIVEAAAELHHKLSGALNQIQTVRVSVPDYYLNILIHPKPSTAAEAMFSAEYCVAVGLVRGAFDMSSLSDTCLCDGEVQRIIELVTVNGRVPRDKVVYYDAQDPDVVEVILEDGTVFRSECSIPKGDSLNPLSTKEIRSKFDSCLSKLHSPVEREEIWSALISVPSSSNLNELLEMLPRSSRVAPV